MKKLRRDLTVAMAGACAGLFSTSVFLLADRVQAHYDYLSSIDTTSYHVHDLSWVPLVVWHMVLSIVASLAVHRYATSRSSTFLRWQAIGVVALVGWGLTAFIAIGVNCLMYGSIGPIERLFTLSDLAPVAQFVAAVFASNVLFGTAIQAALMEETNERDVGAST